MNHKNILLVDDDDDDQFIFMDALKEVAMNIECRIARNGIEALEHLHEENQPPSLIFLDLLMPRVDGWGVIDYVRSHRGTHNPRVFVVTGVQNQKLSAADQDVVTGLLYKPIDIAEIEKLVQKST